MLAAKTQEIAEEVCRKDFDSAISISDEKPSSEVDTVGSQECDNVSDDQIREQKECESEEKDKSVENVVDEAAGDIQESDDGNSEKNKTQLSNAETIKSEKVIDKESLDEDDSTAEVQAEVVLKRSDEKQTVSTDNEFSGEQTTVDNEIKKFSIEMNDAKTRAIKDRGFRLRSEIDYTAPSLINPETNERKYNVI